MNKHHLIINNQQRVRFIRMIHTPTNHQCTKPLRQFHISLPCEDQDIVFLPLLGLCPYHRHQDLSQSHLMPQNRRGLPHLNLTHLPPTAIHILTHILKLYMSPQYRIRPHLLSIIRTYIIPLHCLHSLINQLRHLTIIIMAFRRQFLRLPNIISRPPLDLPISYRQRTQQHICTHLCLQRMIYPQVKHHHLFKHLL